MGYRSPEGPLGLRGLKVAESDIQVVARLRAVAECEDHPVESEEDKFFGTVVFFESLRGCFGRCPRPTVS